MSALRQAAAALRAEVRSALPERSFLRVDRTGSALYVVSASEHDFAADGWLCQNRGSILLLSPGMAHLETLRKLTPIHPLTAAFAARPADEAALPILAACLRALEMPPAPSSRTALDKQLRQAMAVALRTGSGGGLELCHALFLLIDQ